jgi:hypothetical protein
LNIDFIPYFLRMGANEEKMISTFHGVAAPRASRRANNSFFVQILSRVESVQGEKPTEYLHLLGDEGLPNVGQVGALKLSREGSISTLSGESGTIEHRPMISRTRKLHILQQNTKRQELASSGRG